MDCVTVRLSLHRRPPSFAAIMTANGKVFRNPTKYTISGSMADLRQAYRNSLCGTTFQAVSTLYGFLTPFAAYAEGRK